MSTDSATPPTPEWPVERPQSGDPGLAEILDQFDGGGVRLLLQREPEVATVELVKEFGETQVAGQEGPLDGPPWSWGSR